jgi:hypothetical protein
MKKPGVDCKAGLARTAQVLNSVDRDVLHVVVCVLNLMTQTYNRKEGQGKTRSAIIRFLFVVNIYSEDNDVCFRQA